MRVVLVEDDESYAYALSRWLEREAIDVVGWADNVRDGQRLAVCGAADAAILDNRLPDGSGAEIEALCIETATPHLWVSANPTACRSRGAPVLGKSASAQDIVQALTGLNLVPRSLSTSKPLTGGNPVGLLVIEDEMYVSMEVAQEARRLGMVPLPPERTVNGALARIVKGGVDAAVLDHSLADGAADKVALVLREHGIPWIWSTVAHVTSFPQLGAPLLRKPFLLQNLTAMLTWLQGAAKQTASGFAH